MSFDRWLTERRGVWLEAGEGKVEEVVNGERHEQNGEVPAQREERAKTALGVDEPAIFAIVEVSEEVGHEQRHRVVQEGSADLADEEGEHLVNWAYPPPQLADEACLRPVSLAGFVLQHLTRRDQQRRQEHHAYAVVNQIVAVGVLTAVRVHQCVDQPHQRRQQ